MFVDSRTALGTVIRGASRKVHSRSHPHSGLWVGKCRQADYNRLVSEVWLRAAVSDTQLSFWWVPSRLNPTDAGTRVSRKWRELRELAALGFQRVAWRWPDFAPWASARKRMDAWSGVGYACALCFSQQGLALAHMLVTVGLPE